MKNKSKYVRGGYVTLSLVTATQLLWIPIKFIQYFVITVFAINIVAGFIAKLWEGNPKLQEFAGYSKCAYHLLNLAAILLLFWPIPYVASPAAAIFVLLVDVALAVGFFASKKEG